MATPLLRPAYRIVIGDHVVDTREEPRASTVVDLRVQLDMDAPVDSFSCQQGQVGGLRPAVGDDASLDLGYDDDTGLTRVLTGVVVAVEPGLRTKRVVGHSTTDALVRTFVDTTFENTTAGAVVRALAAEAGIGTARIEEGPEFPAYVVDGRRTAARHVRDLADLAGFDTYVTADGELVFEAFSGNRTVHVLRYAEHLLDAEVRRTRLHAGTVETWGESPGASSGDESWAWLTKDFAPHRGSSGTGSPVLVVERPALRTARAAAAAADAIAETLQERTVQGRVRVQGQPQVRPGDLVRLEGFPDAAGVDELEATYQVRGVVHRLDKRCGFVTDLVVHSLAGAAATAVAGGGLP